MARSAANTFINMDAMVKVNIVRQIVDACPFDRNTGLPTIPNRFKIGRCSPKLTVAIHARLRRRHPGGTRCFDRRMAIPAIDTIIANVMLVAKLHRLCFDNFRLIPVGRARNADKNSIHCYDSDSTREKNRCPCNRVRASMKNLPHYAINLR
jgi:hypothetical protein